MDTNEIQGKKCSVRCNCNTNHWYIIWGVIIGLGIASLIFGILYQPEPVNYQLEDTGAVK